MDFVTRFKALPSKTRNLMSLGIIIALVVALPLFVWALVNMNFNQQEKAATGEPPIGTPINWTTSDVTITADDFYITSNGKTYYGDSQNVTIIPGVVDTGPNPVRWANIEVRSTQYGDDLRMKIYFKSEGSTWNIFSIGILNSNYSNSWVSYNNPLIYTVLSYPHYQNGETNIALNDPVTGQKILDVHFVNLKIQAFTDATPPPTATTATPTASPTVTASPTASPTATATATATTTSTATSAPITGDVNGDGRVNIVDIGIIVDHYGKSASSYPKADLNGDGKINMIDIGIVIDNY